MEPQLRGSTFPLSQTSLASGEVVRLPCHRLQRFEVGWPCTKYADLSLCHRSKCREGALGSSRTK
eukprot:1256869-Amphidinium_carterae.1